MSYSETVAGTARTRFGGCFEMSWNHQTCHQILPKTIMIIWTSLSFFMLDLYARLNDMGRIKSTHVKIQIFSKFYNLFHTFYDFIDKESRKYMQTRTWGLTLWLRRKLARMLHAESKHLNLSNATLHYWWYRMSFLSVSFRHYVTLYHYIFGGWETRSGYNSTQFQRIGKPQPWKGHI